MTWIRGAPCCKRNRDVTASERSLSQPVAGCLTAALPRPAVRVRVTSAPRPPVRHAFPSPRSYRCCGPLAWRRPVEHAWPVWSVMKRNGASRSGALGAGWGVRVLGRGGGFVEGPVELAHYNISQNRGPRVEAIPHHWCESLWEGIGELSGSSHEWYPLCLSHPIFCLLSVCLVCHCFPDLFGLAIVQVYCFLCVHWTPVLCKGGYYFINAQVSMLKVSIALSTLLLKMENFFFIK